MSDTLPRVAIGKVIGYKTSLNPLSHESIVVVKVDDMKVFIQVDTRQQQFIKKEYPVGSSAAVGFYGGEWHIGSKPTSESAPIFDTSISIQEIIDNLKTAGPC